MKKALNQEVEGLFVGQFIDLLTERKEGYLRASEKIPDPYLKQLFYSHYEVTQLQIQDLQNFSLEEFSSSIFLNWKQWGEIQEALKTEQRATLLEACINGEQNTIYLYNEILKSEYILPELKVVLNRHLDQIRSACDLLKVFKIVL